MSSQENQTVSTGASNRASMPPRELLLSPVRHAQGELTLPGSKSISNRVLLLAALAQGSTRIQGLLKSDDTDVMLAALTTLGVPIHRVSDSEVIVTGVPDWRTLGSPLRTSNTSHTSQIHTDLFLGNAGTAFRPLTAALAVWGGDYVLRGVPRMHERPIGDLVDALRQWGASVEYLEQPGFPPLQIGLGRLQQAFSCQEIDSVRDPQTNPIVNRQPNLEPRQHLNSTTASRIHVKGSVSSQFLTALLMVAPIVAKQTQQAVEIEVMGTLISKPYIEITVNLMARFGVQVQRVGEQIYRIEPQAQYVSPGRLEVEGDASSASYFMALGLIGGGPVVVKGVDEHSIQGDVQFVSVLKAMGAQVTCGPLSIQTQRASEVSGVTRATSTTSSTSTTSITNTSNITNITNITNTIGKGPFGKLRAFDLDFNLIPDAAMTAAVLAIYADGPCTLRNIASWRVKETDRIHAMQTELTKLGARVQSGEDWLTVWPIEEHAWRSARIHTYDDHRMAMCFSLAAFGPVPITILDPGCVAKTFPDYFTVYERLVSA